MFTMTITLPIYVVLLLIIAGVALGYAVRAGQRLKLRKTISELEEASNLDNSRILELEKETLSLETRLREWQIPVIPLKKPVSAGADPGTPKIPALDMSLRKQLLKKNNDNRHSASR